jgi:hypothetical protein
MQRDESDMTHINDIPPDRDPSLSHKTMQLALQQHGPEHGLEGLICGSEWAGVGRVTLVLGHVQRCG